MTNAELERLAILVEECAEVQHIAMKIIRHGYESWSPFDDNRTPNRQLLEKELGDLQFIIDKMCHVDDVDKDTIALRSVEKSNNIKPYLHHNSSL
jgi:hypothetical protein